MAVTRALRFWILMGLCASSMRGAGPVFTETIQPTLKQKCLGCHGEGNTFGNLDLRSRAGLLKGGSHGAAIIPGNASESLLYKALLHEGELKMPPARLPAETIQAFRVWIDAGAEFDQAWDRYKDEDLWAFRPVRKPAPGATIDSLLLAALKNQGLEPAPAAGRRTLLRRATFDLTGLPPTPEELSAFVSDASGDRQAFAKVVDRLLASPAYGERWARHWLDVARYADSNGYSNDYERPNAWRYRDYVIRAFQNDKPYDRFVLEQIAGDELFPGEPEAILATGFLRAGPWEHTGMSVAAETRQMWLDDVTHSTAAVFLGLTLGCARCHDHKFDPLPTRDYYRMQAVFATTAFARRPLPFLDSEPRGNFEAGRRQLDALIAQTKANAAGGQKAKLTPQQQEEVKLYRKHLAMYQESAFRYQPFALSVSSGLVEAWNDVGPEGARSYMTKADYLGAQVRVLTGGSLQAPADSVDPGVLSAVERYGGYSAPDPPNSPTGRRAALARWIASPANPLTARVLVNRVWQYHFGKGLAENANNLGKMGKRPSNPALLDLLAARFVESGWSVKQLHRMILLSNAYRRSGARPAQAERKDPDNRLLSYFPPRRLEAEALRDSMLAVSGELSPSRGGPGTFPTINSQAARQPRHAMGTLRPVYWPSPSKSDRNRRSIYCFQQRGLVDPMIESFNGAGMDFSCERRDATTVPTQAFTLLNGEVSRTLALALAARVANDPDPIERAFRLAFQRGPSAGERAAARKHVTLMTGHHRRTPPPAAARWNLERSITSELTGERFLFQEPAPPWEFEPDLQAAAVTPEVRALAGLALVLFNANEFVYVD